MNITRIAYIRIRYIFLTCTIIQNYSLYTFYSLQIDFRIYCSEIISVFDSSLIGAV